MADADDDESHNLVIDLGSGFIRTGYAGDDAPRAGAMPSTIARYYDVADHLDDDDASSPPQQKSVSEKARNCRHTEMGFGVFDEGSSAKRVGVFELSHPISRGVVTNWDDFEMLLRHNIQHELGLQGEDQSCEDYRFFLTEAILNPRSNRDKLSELMFEKFNVRAMYVGIQAVLALYASGRITGLAVESGAQVTQLAPIYEGCCVLDAVQRINFGGDDLTEFMEHLIRDEIRSDCGGGGGGNKQQPSQSLTYIADQVKRRECVCVPDFDEAVAKQQKASALERTYSLPDSTVVRLAPEKKLLVTEALFRPEVITAPSSSTTTTTTTMLQPDAMLLDKRQEEEPRRIPSLQDLIATAIDAVPIDTRKHLARNVVLSGGNTKFQDIDRRLARELPLRSAHFLNISRTHVIAAPERHMSVWIGGSIVASLSSMTSQWVKRSEYFEEGCARY